MASPALAKHLDQIVEAALAAAPAGTPIRSISETIIRDNGELIDGLMEDWRVRLVTGLLRRKQAQMAREERSAQLLLPGFEHLPAQITVSDGQRRPLATATYRQLREYLVVLRRRQKDSPRLQQVLAAMDLLKKWSKKLKDRGRGLTVAEAMEREVAAGPKK